MGNLPPPCRIGSCLSRTEMAENEGFPLKLGGLTCRPYRVKRSKRPARYRDGRDVANPPLLLAFSGHRLRYDGSKGPIVFLSAVQTAAWIVDVVSQQSFRSGGPLLAQ